VAVCRGLANVPAISQAGEQTVRGARDQARSRRDLGDAEMIGRPERLQDIESAVDRLHAPAAL
jgi:hypothetical protein